MPSSGGGVLCGCGSKFALWFGSGIASVPALTAGERCVLAASEVVGGGGGGDKVSDRVFSCVAR